ncbi:MAG: hypothetical protein HKM29_04310 [Deltaproteobacteria bacterium]|nr:hypothetical protein [Deltaproteobacteria bacterium]
MTPLATHAILLLSFIAFSSFLAVPRTPPRQMERKRSVFPLLVTVVLLFALPSSSLSRIIQIPEETGPPGVRMSGGEFTPELAAEEIRVAVREGTPGKVSSLLSTWPELLEVRDVNGMTPLFLAAVFDQPEIVRLLLDSGADMHAANRFGAMPFHQAAYAGHRRIVEMLLERGEKVDMKDGDDRTALHLTAWNNRHEIALLLIEKGARVNTGDSAGKGATPLHYAAALGSADVARILLEHCANIDTMAMEGATPLHLAVSRKKAKLVRLLLAYNAEVTRKDGNGRTAIDLASFSSDRDLEGLLLGRGEPTVGGFERQTRRKCPNRK